MLTVQGNVRVVA